ncbi:DUF4190 domain-containing protein [Citricoccus sp. NR2]|uniref:DUF4190 domain-containing protein n=1 Tax=Citricoccus sp. NR2 TaxID=3004095 RepID=UPI0022DD555F|nr:DUF4190 domain-containing protein [Citricoccus sp. NR2]WBL19062.1 DUF4190 domain-containing protein [Citricoccus sp. NR2]
MTQPPYSSGSESDPTPSDGASGTPSWYDSTSGTGGSSEQNPYESVPPYTSQGAGNQPGDGYAAPNYAAGQPEQYGQYGQTGQYGQYGNPQEGQSAATTSLVLGIIGLFAFGIILGPLAIFFAGKAERNGVPATAGKVIGWIVTILWALGVVFIILSIVFGLFLAGSGVGYSY